MPEFQETLYDLVPEDGGAIGNRSLKEQFLRLAPAATDADFDAARDALIAQGKLVKGKGRGGSVRRAGVGNSASDFRLQAQHVPAELPLRKPRAAKAPRAASGRSGNESTAILSYRHPNKRKNNPEVGVVTPETDPEQPKTTWAYDPHIDPALQFDSRRAQVEKLIDEALASGDAAVMCDALEQLKRQSAPYLNWTGKAERTSFEVDTVSLHVHERIDPMSLLSALRKDIKNPSPSGRGAGVRASGFQPGLFEAPFENLPLRDAVDFYKHEKGWSNRLIAGDSLLVMNSLLQKESMAGQVQMIYIDPPYGIKYGSNFQPFVNKRDVKDRKDEDLTQEPETIKAFRDTWELGIHSYLTYLRDRLLLARELLSESGSVFVQISDENLHHVREVMAEIFDEKNFIALITVQKTTSSTNPHISGVADYLVWYAKNKDKAKYRELYRIKEAGGEGAEHYGMAQFPSGERRALTMKERTTPDTPPVYDLRRLTADQLQSAAVGRDKGEGAACWFEVIHEGRRYLPNDKNRWKTNEDGLRRLCRANRVVGQATALRYARFLDDFPAYPLHNIWTDLGGAADRTYVVQTNQKIIERCLLMTTDPGDLVLDPTCGSGTTAYVAEKWGRRWITCDTSRVAVTLAKQRLMTASYDYYALKYPHEGLKGGFIYKTVPHVTLKSIANNPEIDDIYERMHPAIEAALFELNATLSPQGRGGKTAPSPQPSPLKGEGVLREWEVPFDFPADWPEAARKASDAFHAARQAMQKQMDASIAAHADQEILYDQPQPDKKKLRITGPFSVEAVPFPSVKSLDETAPSPLPLSQGERGYQWEADASVARSGESARQHGWRDELLKTGIRGKGGQMLKFAELETLPDTKYLHCTGHLDTGERVVVSFGPEHAALEQRQVEMAMREAGELFPRPKMIVFCAFAFDPEAAKDIDCTRGITALKAQMNTDLLTDDLKKARASNQSFWLMGQPDVEVRKISSPSPLGGEGRGEGDVYQVEVHGFDYFDTARGELVSGGKGKIAMWLLDTDYDERSLFPRQVFFPMAGKGEGWQKLKKDIKAELNEDRLEQFHGTVSLPFTAGENRKIAVKIIDDRGIESLKVIGLE
jgi:adenine-specific DNA-methyltransferase